jgi:uroporphyrin-III C-methyltransferase/precorrin-2 dehydrogenase/sirohydrochlorin ferrochelatase
MSELLPLFVNLAGRRVLLVGGGPVAASKLMPLRAAGADVQVVAPEVHPDIEQAGVAIARRPFEPADLDGVWLVVAAATPEANRVVAEAAEARRVFVNAVDDPANASAFLSGVVRRDGVTIGISTNGEAPALTALMREALEALLPRDLGQWMDESRRQRAAWKRDGIPMAERRPLLLQALNRLYETAQTSHAKTPARSSHSAPKPGHVSLVGAGPGDPALLTRAAVARLRAADLVLYDALVNERVLRLARKSQRFFVGKRAGRHALSQHAIHGVMIRAARRGRRVVRLKGGDPLVFGRGGEEAIALQQAGVPFDIVPGVSSAVAGPALAGIPVTHRGVASSFVVVSGHDEHMFAASIRGLAPAGVTVVVLMGLARRAALAAVMIEQGWPVETPAALVAEASTPQQEVWRGSLSEMSEGRALTASDGPALFVVGDVAAMDLSWRKQQAPRSAGVSRGQEHVSY